MTPEQAAELIEHIAGLRQALSALVIIAWLGFCGWAIVTALKK